MIRGEAPIRDAYRDDGVARAYVENRFREPLGALLHRTQVGAVTELLRRVAPRRVLELAPGPARLTVETVEAASEPIVILDASRQMLSEARRRLASTRARTCHCIQGDGFVLPFAETFDLVYTFRLIRHFDRADRERLYAEVRRVLKPGGLLVFDAVNEPVSAAHRQADPDGHVHYDAMFEERDLRAELEAAGFVVDSLQGVQHRYNLLHRLQVLVAPRSRWLAGRLMALVDRSGGAPMEWIVTCRRA